MGLWLNGDSEALTGLASGGIKGELPDDRGLGQWTVGPSDCLMTRQDWIGHRDSTGTRVERVTDLGLYPSVGQVASDIASWLIGQSSAVMFLWRHFQRELLSRASNFT